MEITYEILMGRPYTRPAFDRKCWWKVTKNGLAATTPTAYQLVERWGTMILHEYSSLLASKKKDKFTIVLFCKEVQHLMQTLFPDYTHYVEWEEGFKVSSMIEVFLLNEEEHTYNAVYEICNGNVPTITFFGGQAYELYDVVEGRPCYHRKD